MLSRNRQLAADTAFKLLLYGLVARLLGGDIETVAWLLGGLLVVSAFVSLVEAWRTGETLRAPHLTRIDQAAVFLLAAAGLGSALK